MTLLDNHLSTAMLLVPAALAVTACELPAKLGDLPGDPASEASSAGAVDDEESVAVCGEGGAAGELAWSYERDELPGFVSGLAIAPDGAVVAVGGQGELAVLDAHVRKYDPAGALLWSQTYAGAAGLPDHALAVKTDAAGFVHVLVKELLALDPDTGSFDARLVVLRYTPDGALAWRWEHATLPFAVDGGYEPGGELALVGGQIVVLERAEGAPILRLALDTAGQLVEEIEVAAPAGLRVQHAALGADGSPLLAGEVEPGGQSGQWIGRFTPAGAPAWSDQLDDGDDGIHLLLADGAGGAYVAWQRVVAAGVFEYHLRRYGAGGDAQWTTQLPALGAASDGVVRCDGSLLLTGAFDLPTTADADLWIARYAGDGTLQWQLDQAFGFREGVRITATPAGDAVISGNLIDEDAGSKSRPWLARFGSG
jgi:hypothetical protein